MHMSERTHPRSLDVVMFVALLGVNIGGVLVLGGYLAAALGGQSGWWREGAWILGISLVVVAVCAWRMRALTRPSSESAGERAA